MEEDIQRWWDRATEDLETAKFNFRGKKYRAAAFFSQQATEKALKALYIKRFRKLKRLTISSYWQPN
ncbi:MAG: HEPN domain-containing protein [Methanosarcinales archaeon]|nr:HEPN domain-containing protein [Methanosarcinales archaeon]